MTDEVRGYLQRVARRLGVEPRRGREILKELEGHLEDRAQELREWGLPLEQAVRRALLELGDPGHLAKAFTSVYGRTPWGQTALAASPHLLWSLAFLLHLWTSNAWMAALVAGSTLVPLIAWRRGSPDWVFPWLGYALVAPVATAGLTLSEVGYALGDLALGERPPLPGAAYAPLALYPVTVGVVVWLLWLRALRRDWLYAALAVLPFPFLLSRLLYLNQHGGPFAYEVEPLLATDAAMALVFGALALATAGAYRFSQRNLKVGVLAAAVPVLVLFSAYSFDLPLLSGPTFLLLLFAIGLVLLPALMDPWLGSPGRHRPV